MNGQGVFGHELSGSFPREFDVEATTHVDLGQFLDFELWLFAKLAACVASAHVR